MNRAQLKVLVTILNDAASEFCLHGYNDFDLTKQGLTPEELENFKDELTKYVPPDAPQYLRAGDVVDDWLVIRYLQAVAKKEIAGTVT